MKYIELEFEIIEFDTEDIIVTSGDCDFNGVRCDFNGSKEACPLDTICNNDYDYCDVY